MRIKNSQILDFPGSTVDKNLPANAEDVGSILVQEESTYCEPQLTAETREPQLLKSVCSRAHNKEVAPTL